MAITNCKKKHTALAFGKDFCTLGTVQTVSEVTEPKLGI